MARGLGGTDRNPGDRPLVEARRKVSGVPRWSRTRVQPRILERAAAGPAPAAMRGRSVPGLESMRRCTEGGECGGPLDPDRAMPVGRAHGRPRAYGIRQMIQIGALGSSATRISLLFDWYPSQTLTRSQKCDAVEPLNRPPV